MLHTYFDRLPPLRLFLWHVMWLTGLFLEGGIFERPCASVQPVLWSHAGSHCHAVGCSLAGSLCLAKCLRPDLWHRRQGQQPCPGQCSGPPAGDDGISGWGRELLCVTRLRSLGRSRRGCGRCIPSLGSEKPVRLHHWHGWGSEETWCGCQVIWPFVPAGQHFRRPQVGPQGEGGLPLGGDNIKEIDAELKAREAKK